MIQYRPGNGNPLAFPAGQIAAVLVQLCVVAIREIHNEGVGVGYSGGLNDLLFGGAWFGVADIVHDGAVEQKGLLKHNPDLGTQPGLLNVPNIYSIHQNPAFIDIIEAGQQINHR
ncbi:hypothetical protein D3C76_1481820 [compost metagenome]